MPDKKKKPTHTRKNEYKDLYELILDNIPFEGQPIGWTSSFYFDALDLEKIAKTEFPKMNMRLMLGDKLNTFEKLGLELFIAAFHGQTGIWLNDSSTYQHLLKKQEKNNGKLF